jgi:hypothetical protein
MTSAADITGSGLTPLLISFDIDGTLEVGDPPGVISMEMVRQVKRLGHLVGSCSDRPVSYQRQIWQRLEIPVDFTVLKHRLADVKARFSAQAYYHIGDTDIDHDFARAAGFRFLRADADTPRAWWPHLFLGPGR